MTTAGGNNQDIQVTPQMMVFGGAGGRSGEGRLQVDGLSIGSTIGGGGSTAYIADISNAEEVVTTNSGGLGESEVGGPALNIVPQNGGNTLQGLRPTCPACRTAGSAATTREDLEGTPGWRRRARSSSSGTSTPGVGGPIKKDALWYFVTARDEGQHRTIPGIFPNLNAGDPTKYLYVPDTTQAGARRGKLAARRASA